MPLLRMYGVMLACYLIVTSVSVKRYPAFSGLLWIEGGLVEFTTCVVYGVIVLSSLWAYIVRLRSPVLIATFVTAALCMASEMSLVFWIMHDSTPDVPVVGEGKVFLDAPHDLIKLAYLNIVVERSTLWIVCLLILFAAIALLIRAAMQKSLFSRAQALTPESIIFLVLFIAAGLIATVMELEIFSPNSNPAQEEGLELWAAFASLFAVGSLRAAPTRGPSTSLQSEVRLDV